MPDNLRQVIKEIRYPETGINFNTRNTANDPVLTTAFLNRKDLQTSISHPDHRKVVQYLDTIRDQTAVVNYKF